MILALFYMEDNLFSGEKLQSQSKNKTDPDKHSTTFEFLKGLGLAGSPNKSSQLVSFYYLEKIIPCPLRRIF